VDKAGNTYIANLIPDESLRTVSRAEVVMYSFAAGLVVMFLIIGFTVWQWYRARKRRSDPEGEPVAATGSSGSSGSLAPR